MPDFEVRLTRTVRLHKVVHVEAGTAAEARQLALRQDDGEDYCDPSDGRRRVESIAQIPSGERPLPG